MSRAPHDLVAAVAACLLAEASCAQSSAIASTTFDAPVVGELLADTDGDGKRELLVLHRDGLLRRIAIGASDAAGFVDRGAMFLRDPARTLVACRDALPTPGEEVLVLEPRGAFSLAWPEDGSSKPKESMLNRRARCAIRVGSPQWSPFAQDLNGDGLLDLLAPTLQGCTPFLQSRASGQAAFSAMPTLPLPVSVGAQRGGPSLDEDHQGSVVVPRVETEDLNGDGKPDLLTRVDKKRRFQLQGQDGTFGPAIEVDLAQFEDSTTKAEVALGSTAVPGDEQQIQRGDIDGDSIPDFVIAHRRKIWTFVSSKQGPQFEKARTQAVADDVTGMLLLDLDDDAKTDLLAFQVQLPSVGALLLGLVQSIDIDVRAVGYRSGGDGFEPKPAWRRVVTLRIPSILSLLSRQEEIVQRFTELLEKARPVVRGAFLAEGSRDLAMVDDSGASLQVFAQSSAPPDLASKSGRRMLRTLLFEDPDPVFDLDRIFGLLSGALDQRKTRLQGDGKAQRSAPLRDPEQWRLVSLLAGDLDGEPLDEVVAVYEPVEESLVAQSRRAVDVLKLRADPR